MNINFLFCFMFRVNIICGSAGKESACSLGNLGSIPGQRNSPGEGKVSVSFSSVSQSRLTL